MARESKNRRIRVRGRQREDIDLDLLIQALIAIAEDQIQQERQGVKSSDNSTEDRR